MADLYRGRPDVVVATGLLKIGGERLRESSGQDIGDIDVLVADLRAHRLEPLEAKNLALARTPAELHSQLEEMFAGEAGGRSHAELHALRAAWITDHVSETLQTLKLSTSDADAWSIEPKIVLSRAQPSAYLAASPVAVISYRDLRARLASSQSA